MQCEALLTLGDGDDDRVSRESQEDLLCHARRNRTAAIAA